MARYIIRRSYINVLGRLWMPMVLAASRIDVYQSDIENMRDDDGVITRDSIEIWLTAHTGDFSTVLDFSASIEDGSVTVDIPWTIEDNRVDFDGCMYLDNED